MPIIHCILFVSLAFIICLTSAFSTRFIMEGVGEEKKTPEMGKEIRTQKKEENNNQNLIPQSLDIEVIPVVSNAFSPTDELFHMTPLKLAMLISAQHLLSSVQNIPIAEDTSQDTLAMFSDIVKEFNKTAQIIKLTAEYVNISSHYILSTLEEFITINGKQDNTGEKIKNIRQNFFKIIENHIARAVKEMIEKSKQRDITGSDILVSSAYQIVTAFQEMTNQVLTLNGEKNKDFNSHQSVQIITSNNDKDVTPENKVVNDIYETQEILEQGKPHKSIKKDRSKSEDKFTNSDDKMLTRDLNNNQDLTVEVFSPEIFLQNKKKKDVFEKTPEHELKEPENLKFQFSPLTRLTFFDDSKKEGNDNKEHDKEMVDKQMQTQKAEKEFVLSGVDSLSNVPPESYESEPKAFNKPIIVQNSEKVPRKWSNILELLAPGYKQPSQYEENQQQCDDHFEPVCGIDKGNKSFIVFLNDCKRNAYNDLHGTNYISFSLNTCVGLFQQNSTQGTLKLPPINTPPTPFDFKLHN